MNRPMTGLVLMLALAGCTNPGGLSDALHPTGGATLVASSDHAAMYAVNTEEGTVARYASGSTAVDAVDVGSEPTRISRAGDRVFVTLRGERAVAVMEETSAGLQLVEKIAVGAEPYGMVASEDGSRVYVAVSQSNEVVEIDARASEVRRTWSVPKEPRYVALHPSGDVLFVGSGNGEALLTRIDLRESAPTAAQGEPAGEPVAMPGVVRFDEDMETFALTVRITGDMAISPDGEQLVVPVVYVDNITPVETPDPGEEVPVQDGYASTPREGIGRFNPAVVVIPVSPGGDVDGAGEAVFIAGDRLQGTFGNATRVRSYPSSVTISPDSTFWLVTMQGSDTLAVVGALPFDEAFRNGFDEPMMDAMPEPGFDPDGGGGTQLPFTPTHEAGLTARPKSLIQTMFAPNGVVFTDDETAWVHSTFERKIGNTDFGELLEQVRRNGLNGFDELSSTRMLSVSPELGSLGDMPSDAERGRRLFFASTNQSMVASGAGVSCASCHFDGRNDGLTWSFSSGDRQTPSLAGQVSLTAPVTWTSDVESVAMEAQLTTELRMGGHSASFNPDVAPPDYDAIAAFVEWTRYADGPLRGETSDAITRGQAIFERQDVGCASCHSGVAFTDNLHHDMFGLVRVNTPTLRGIAASAPYLHDGRASDLREVLDWSRSGEMGDTSMLSEAEMSDLEAYLRSL